MKFGNYVCVSTVYFNPLHRIKPKKKKFQKFGDSRWYYWIVSAHKNKKQMPFNPLPDKILFCLSPHVSSALPSRISIPSLVDVITSIILPNFFFIYFTNGSKWLINFQVISIIRSYFCLSILEKYTIEMIFKIIFFICKNAALSSYCNVQIIYD